ncbi:MAG: hypothetical protein KJ687_02915 [Proteobacteria bacterium]|nr:hypothetical protein [Pseudomonadota bacterium]
MRVNKGWKEIYKRLSWYNRQKFIEANRPFGKDPKGFIKMLMWFLAILFIIGIVLIIGKR